MLLFSLFKRKTLTDEDIEKEYQKAQRKVQHMFRSSLIRDVKQYSEAKCIPQEGDDLLAKKEEFIRYCSFVARTDRYYHSLNYKKGRYNSSPLWCQKWYDHEQKERLLAQKRWREMSSNTR